MLARLTKLAKSDAATTTGQPMEFCLISKQRISGRYGASLGLSRAGARHLFDKIKFTLR